MNAAERDALAFTNLVKAVLRDEEPVVKVGSYWSAQEMRKRFYRWRRASQEDASLREDLSADDLYKAQAQLRRPEPGEFHWRLRFSRRHNPLEEYTDDR